MNINWCGSCIQQEIRYNLARGGIGHVSGHDVLDQSWGGGPDVPSPAASPPAVPIGAALLQQLHLVLAPAACQEGTWPGFSHPLCWGPSSLDQWGSLSLPPHSFCSTSTYPQAGAGVWLLRWQDRGLGCGHPQRLLPRPQIPTVAGEERIATWPALHFHISTLLNPKWFHWIACSTFQIVLEY